MSATYQRKRVKALLKISTQAMDALFPTSICPGGRIAEEAVCRVLNAHAVAIQPVHYIPGLITEEELAEATFTYDPIAKGSIEPATSDLNSFPKNCVVIYPTENNNAQAYAKWTAAITAGRASARYI